MSLETIRISKQGRDQLIKLKRWTGIPQWNILCRWAFCVSLAEPSPPRQTQVRADGAVEMTWRTFTGEHDAVYRALLVQRCLNDGLEPSDATLAKQLRFHLHRGIGYLAGNRDLNSIAALVSQAVDRERCPA
jgi:DNA sulfur modification protein DndE